MNLEDRSANRRVAKKSTATPPQPTRPPPQLARPAPATHPSSNLTSQLRNLELRTRRTATIAKTTASVDRFLENFNPETSIREKRKLNRKIHPVSNVRRPPGALYDENGIHINTCTDLCDCLIEECVGCFFKCPRCNSQKCGIDCRIHRKFNYDSLEYYGFDVIVKNPLLKN